MAVDKGKYSCWIILVIMLYVFVPQIYRSCIKINKLKNERKQLAKKIELEKNKIEEYNKRIEELKDEFYREKISRDELQMVKEGEEIYRLIKKKQEER